MTIQGDMPDWQTQVAPDAFNASFTNIGAGLVDQLFQSASPYRIWAVWVDVSIASSSTITGLPVTWGAQVNDGSGHALLRVQRHVGAVSAHNGGGLAIPLQGFTPFLSSGFYTTNLITDAGISGLFTRASGGILYSQP